MSAAKGMRGGGPPLLRTSQRSLAEAKAAEGRVAVRQVESAEQLLSVRGTGRFSRDNVPSEWDVGYIPGATPFSWYHAPQALRASCQMRFCVSATRHCAPHERRSAADAPAVAYEFTVAASPRVLSLQQCFRDRCARTCAVTTHRPGVLLSLCACAPCP